MRSGIFLLLLDNVSEIKIEGWLHNQDKFSKSVNVRVKEHLRVLKFQNKKLFQFL